MDNNEYEGMTQHECEMHDCEMYGKSCSYGICDECPLVNPEYRRND